MENWVPCTGDFDTDVAGGRALAQRIRRLSAGKTRERGLVIVNADPYLYRLVLAPVIFVAVLLDGIRQAYRNRFEAGKIRSRRGVRGRVHPRPIRHDLKVPRPGEPTRAGRPRRVHPLSFDQMHMFAANYLSDLPKASKLWNNALMRQARRFSI